MDVLIILDTTRILFPLEPFIRLIREGYGLLSAEIEMIKSRGITT